MTEMSSSAAPAASMRSISQFDRKVEEMKPTKSEINWVIMDYLISEGYPGAAEKFSQESNCSLNDLKSIRERVQIRDAIYAGKIDAAIEKINEVDPELQLIEIIRNILAKDNPQSAEFRPALEFATEQLSPRAPTDLKYQQALERTMALMIFPTEKMAPEFKELLDLGLREKVAESVNGAILRSKGQRSEAKIRQLVRARAWAETQAREAKVDIPTEIPIGLDVPGVSDGTNSSGRDAMMT